MESTAQKSTSHSCSKCTLLPDRSNIFSENYSKICNARKSQQFMMFKRALALIASLCLLMVFVALLITEGATWASLGVLVMAWLLYPILCSFLDPEDTIKELGYYALPGFSGHLMWYGFICPICGGENCDYIHGYDAHITCRLCGVNIYVRSKRFYTNDGRPAPRPWRDLYHLWRMSRRMKKVDNIDSEIQSIEAMGIRVFPPNTDVAQIIKDSEPDKGELPKKS